MKYKPHLGLAKLVLISIPTAKASAMCAELPQDQHLLNFFQRELCVARITTSANTLFCNERSGYHKSPATMISNLKQYLKYLQAKIALFSKPFHLEI